ncbi:hypothetical protein GQX73_g6834 [Xylaria multiplex]|uniref:BTB domain-containing protein n=1 Tax=Xylaria multiplex TaxID=323545 RepID=A0A7C8ILM3_9PEZI|nr:hypothetical protein GQX73_g6834 [Xylaria multiplex]
MSLSSKVKSPDNEHQLRPQVPATTHHSPARAPLGTIGIGVETGFILQSRDPEPGDSSLTLFARSLAANHNRSVPLPNPRMDSLVQNLGDGPSHMAWKLVRNQTCETKSSPWGIEMVSPIFRLMPNSSWRAAIQKTWGFLEENYKVTADETCSTHVHMSIVGDYSVIQVKRLAQAIIHFEPAFEALLPRDQRGNEYARSNWIDNLHFGYGEVSRTDAIAKLERCGTVDEVIELMNPQNSRYFCWNFQGIKKYSTVEFRRGAGSTSSADVFRWVELATSFLRASIKMSTQASIRKFSPDIGGLIQYLSQDVDDTEGVGESRYLWDRFAGLRPSDRLDPIPIGELSPEKRKKLEQKISLDQQSNPILDNIAVAKTQALSTQHQVVTGSSLKALHQLVNQSIALTILHTPSMAHSSRSLEEQLKATSGYSDLTIVCQGVEFAAHRFIVCAHSEVLTAALAGNFSEAESRTVNMDFDLDSVKRFLEFLYTGDYHETPDPALALITSMPTHDKRIQDAMVQQNTEQAIDSVLADQLGNFMINGINETAESWICHCRMSCLADYYNVDRLSAISLAKLEEGLRSEWCVESFCALLLECLDEIGNTGTLCLLGDIAAEHYNEPAIFRLFEAGGSSERLAPFVLTSCIKRLNETKALGREAGSRCEQLKYELGEKESKLTQHLRNLEECKSLLENWSQCRNTNCEAEFKCYFDTKGPDHSPTYILRCARCRCRHE